MRRGTPPQSTPPAELSPPVERFIARLKRNPWITALIALGTVVVAVASFTDAAGKLWQLAKGRSPQDARAELARLSIDYSPQSFLRRAEEGDAIAVAHFLAAGIDPNIVDADGMSALALAASGGHLATVKALLEGKFDVNFRYREGGATALVIA